MPTTLAEALQRDRVGFDALHRDYGPMLQLVKLLIGVVPRCDPYLEIWTPGFRTYNLIIPNFLDLPNSVLGVGAPKDLVGLGMYSSSAAAACPYCTAHTASFALRRGASVEAVQGDARTPAEAATVAVADGLGADPATYSPDLGQHLRDQCGDADAEWIVTAIAMMGFLNKFMDAVGVELEQDAVDDVGGILRPTGWTIGRAGWDGATMAEARPTPPPSDTMKTKATLLRHAPGAVKLSRGWVAGLPRKVGPLRTHIRDHHGWDEALITTMAHAKPAKALGAVLRHNLDPDQSDLGIGLKALAGLPYANHVESTYLAGRAQELARFAGVDPDTLAAADGYFPGASGAAALDERHRAALTLGWAMGPSPAVVDPEIVDAVTAVLTPSEIIEAVVWVSINQLQHRLATYFALT